MAEELASSPELLDEAQHLLDYSAKLGRSMGTVVSTLAEDYERGSDSDKRRARKLLKPILIIRKHNNGRIADRKLVKNAVHTAKLLAAQSNRIRATEASAHNREMHAMNGNMEGARSNADIESTLDKIATDVQTPTAAPQNPTSSGINISTNQGGKSSMQDKDIAAQEITSFLNSRNMPFAMATPADQVALTPDMHKLLAEIAAFLDASFVRLMNNPNDGQNIQSYISSQQLVRHQFQQYNLWSIGSFYENLSCTFFNSTDDGNATTTG